MQRDFRAQDVTERAVGVRQRAEEIRVFVVGARRDDAAARQQHVGFAQTVVHEAVAKARRLDADADGGAADRDVLELGSHERQETALEAVADDRLVGRETLDVDGACIGVEFEYLVELAERDAPGRGAPRLIAEQVRDRRLGKPQLPGALLPGRRGGLSPGHCRQEQQDEDRKGNPTPKVHSNPFWHRH